MTIKDIVKDKSNNSTPPFQVVLIDLKKAAEEQLHCVEKPLMDSGDLKFVAISYRWGELNEVMMDTGVGYSANITSFALRSFFKLCKMMIQENDLKHMDYVWVDAICVDQTNHDKRKATVYQMTNIYQRANYILAVPDLHLDYLKASSRNTEQLVTSNMKHGAYIYYLIQGDTVQLEAYDHEFLDELNIPQEPTLRHLLTRYTHHFAYGLMNCIENDEHFNANIALDHILASAAHKPHHDNVGINIVEDKTTTTTADQLDALAIDKLHVCDNKEKCPLALYHVDDADCKAGKHDDLPLDDPWALQIRERSHDIRRGMDFLADIIKDWSMRAWVVSEYHIAKTKKSHKMKFWFLQLDYFFINPTTLKLDDYSFFEFDFNSQQQDNPPFSFDSVYQTFHDTIKRQLVQQTFLEMMLKTKSSRHPDRFHAILPSSEYKNWMDQVDQWDTLSLMSVKLQLYERMSPKHKLDLLFLSSISDTLGYVLPTFATSDIRWPAKMHMLDETRQCNFNLTNNNNHAIHMMYNNNNRLYQLNIKPREYYRHGHYQQQKERDEKIKSTVRRLLDLPTNAIDMIAVPGYKNMTSKSNDPLGNETDVVFCEEIWGSPFLFLIGSFEKNKWVLKYANFFDQLTHVVDWEYHVCDTTHPGFDIY